jgi:nicotinate-nucleotide pyrophosphorylase (carboxylating)
MAEPQLARAIDGLVARALDEDLGWSGDLTSAAVLRDEDRCRARIEAREGGVVAGLPVAERAFVLVDPRTRVEWRCRDGDGIRAGDVIGSIEGPARSVLAAERVALNFLTHLSGVATVTREFADACAGTESVVLCTRKTLPGLRPLDRYAVELGGGRLHRAGLYDGVLIKDNHVALAGGVRTAVERARRRVPHTVRVQVEVETLAELEEAIAAGADAVLLDNPDVETVKRAVDLVEDRIPLEVSGGMTVERVAEIAGLGKLLISVGRITHSAPALDFSLTLISQP